MIRKKMPFRYHLSGAECIFRINMRVISLGGSTVSKRSDRKH